MKIIRLWWWTQLRYHQFVLWITRPSYMSAMKKALAARAREVKT